MDPHPRDAVIRRYVVKVLDARVRDTINTYNPHRLEILVDEIPDIKNMRHKIRHLQDRTYYFSSEGGYVHFGIHNPRDERGYGGAIFTILDEDGVRLEFKAPWSSRPSVMHEVFGIRSHDVSITSERPVFDRGYTFYAGHVTTDIMIDALRIINTASPDNPYFPIEVLSHGEWHTEIVRYECDYAFVEEEYEWKPGNMQRRRVEPRILHGGLCTGANHFLEGRV